LSGLSVLLLFENATIEARDRGLSLRAGGRTKPV
jgi:hypothetical protein